MVFFIEVSLIFIEILPEQSLLLDRKDKYDDVLILESGCEMGYLETQL